MFIGSPLKYHTLFKIYRGLAAKSKKYLSLELPIENVMEEMVRSDPEILVCYGSLSTFILDHVKKGSLKRLNDIIFTAESHNVREESSFLTRRICVKGILTATEVGVVGSVKNDVLSLNPRYKTTVLDYGIRFENLNNKMMSYDSFILPILLENRRNYLVLKSKRTISILKSIREDGVEVHYHPTILRAILEKYVGTSYEIEEMHEHLNLWVYETDLKIRRALKNDIKKLNLSTPPYIRCTPSQL